MFNMWWLPGYASRKAREAREQIDPKTKKRDIWPLSRVIEECNKVDSQLSNNKDMPQEERDSLLLVRNKLEELKVWTVVHKVFKG